MVVALAGGIISAGGEGLHCGVFCREPLCLYWIDCLGACDRCGWRGRCRYGISTCCGDGVVVKPVTESVELLTGDDKPETITVDFDGAAVLGISNYPRIQLGAMRYTTDTSLIDRASERRRAKHLSVGTDMRPIGQKRTTWLADATLPSSWTLQAAQVMLCLVRSGLRGQ